MSDLHELLYEPLMETDASHNQFERRAALATRMPEAVPAGLKVHESDGTWWIRDPDEGMPLYRHITDEQAELLFIGNAVKVLADALHVDIVIGQPGDDLVQRLATALHALADERDAAKETTDD